MAAKKTTAKSKSAAKKPAAKSAAAKKTKSTSGEGRSSGSQKNNPKIKKPAAKAPAKKTASKKTETKKATSTKKTKSASGEGRSSALQKSNSKAKKEAPKKPDVFRCPISGIPVKPEKPNLSDKTLAKLKDLLLEERQRLIEQAEELAQEAVDLVADREGGDTQFDEESGEGDSIAVERERTLFLSSSALATVEEIDKALERMKNKTYGLCSPSSRRINVARLEALPWTTVCVDCKARSERPR